MYNNSIRKTNKQYLQKRGLKRMSINIEFINKGIEVSDGVTSFKVCCYPFQVDSFPTEWKGCKKYTFNSDTYHKLSKNSRKFYAAFRGENGIYEAFRLAINSTKVREYLETVLTLLDKTDYTKAGKIDTLSEWCTILGACYDFKRRLLLSSKINVQLMEQNLTNVAAYCESIIVKKHPLYETIKTDISFETYLEYKDKPYFNKCLKVYNKQQETKKQLKDTYNEWVQTIPECLKETTSLFLSLREYDYSLCNYFYECKDIENRIEYINRVYLREQEPLKPFNFKQVTCYQDLLNISQKLKEIEHKFRQQEKEKLFKHNQTTLLLPYENAEYEVLIPTSYADCVQYGQQLHNCLGGYEWNNYLEDGRRVAFVVKNKSNNNLVACIDLTTRALNIQQALAPCNQQIPDTTLKNFINIYVDLIKKNHNSKN